jgi:hypothetical protein
MVLLVCPASPVLVVRAMHIGKQMVGRDINNYEVNHQEMDFDLWRRLKEIEILVEKAVRSGTSTSVSTFAPLTSCPVRSELSGRPNNTAMMLLRYRHQWWPGNFGERRHWGLPVAGAGG